MHYTFLLVVGVGGFLVWLVMYRAAAREIAAKYPHTRVAPQRPLQKQAEPPTLADELRNWAEKTAAALAAENVPTALVAQIFEQIKVVDEGSANPLVTKQISGQIDIAVALSVAGPKQSRGRT